MKSLSDESLRLYDAYDYHISGGINGQNVWTLLKVIEAEYPVDDIMLGDGTRLWNLLRVFLYTFHHEHTGKRNLNKMFFVVDMPIKAIIHKVFCKHVSVSGDGVLCDILHYVSSVTGVKEDVLLDSAYSYITVFADMRDHYRKELLRSPVDTVVLSCGYGRLPMAKAQACRDLGIKCIEKQHGIITRYLVAYRRETPTSNHDCVPEYFYAYDEYFAGLVRDGGLFDKDKVLVKGYPKSDWYVLFTGQWILVDETRSFLLKTAELLDDDVALIFKPHPFDDSNYDDLNDAGIIVANREEDVRVFLRGVDVHATVFSTCGIDACVLGVPSVFVDVCHLVKPGGDVVDSPEGFVKKIKELRKE